MLKAQRSGFVENKGQWNRKAKYLAQQTKGVNVWFTDSAVRFDIRPPLGDDDNAHGLGQAIDMSFDGARAGVAPVGQGVRDSRNDYLMGGKRRVLGARKFNGVTYKGLYKGVDLKWYEDKGVPRFDFVVGPGTDPKAIKMRFKGADDVQIRDNVNLALTSKVGAIVQADLKAYQVIDGFKRPVTAQFRQNSDSTIGFALGQYDRTKPLVIDPLVYGSYYGGNAGPDEVRGLVADTDTSVVITGYTEAPDYPAIFGPFGFNILGSRAMFVSKFQGDAYSHDYSCLVTGDGADEGWYAAMSPDGAHVWIAGTSTSTNFPLAGNSRSGTSDIVFIRFTEDQNAFLVPDFGMYYGGVPAETLKGMAIDPLNGEINIVGETKGGLPSTSNSFTGNTDAYITRFSVDPNGITGIAWSHYVGGTGRIFAGSIYNYLGGNLASITDKHRSFNNAIACDSTGNVVIVGSVQAGGNIDTSLDPSIYDTTPGVYFGGRLLRQDDAWIRKYTPAGALVFSSLLGGNEPDEGTGVAVDFAGNIYVTGRSTSFNFPRTRGVYGENFPAAAVVFATKISADGANILYSTHLNTQQWVYPRGIAVDGSGNVYVSGIVDFRHTFPFPPGDPNEPASTVTGSVPITANALDPDYTMNGAPELGTTEGFLLGLSPTATDLFYGTYVGGILDEQLYWPYVDRFGDVWVTGSTDSSRYYERWNAALTTVKIYSTSASLPNSLLSTFAFKRTGDAGLGFPPFTIPDVDYGNTSISPPPLFAPPPTISADYTRDGFLIKQRLSLPTVAALTLSPSSIAGGLGATSTGTITLSGPIPPGGLDVTVDLDNDAASFDPNTPNKHLVISMPGGATTAQFTVYSTPVVAPTAVNVKVTLIGNFMIRVLTVVPWLQDITVTPNSVVGGNTLTARVTLFQNAITDIAVDLSTDNSGLVDFPGGNTVTVPAGLNTAVFPVNTHGVEFQTDVPVTASLLGVGKTNFVRLLAANLLKITFNPAKVTGGASSTGTLLLDGEAGSTFTVDLSINAGTAGYTIVPTTLTFNQGDRSLDFTVNTAYEPVNTQRIITGTRAAQGGYNAQQTSGTLFIDGASLVNFSIAPTAIDPGGTATGTVTVSTPANPSGTPVNMSSDNPIVTVPAVVTVPGSNTTVDFPITASTDAQPNDVIVNITANRGPVNITKQLTVRKSTATLSFNPSQVVGGNGSTGRISVSAPAPVGGLVFSLVSDNTSAATVPATATVPQGATFTTFAATTFLQGSTQVVNVTATSGGIVAVGQLVVRAISVASISFTPAKTKGGTFVMMKVTIDAPAPAGGATVVLFSSNPVVANIPASIVIPAGLTQKSQSVLTKRVSRTVSTQVQAFLGDEVAFATLTVTR